MPLQTSGLLSRHNHLHTAKETSAGTTGQGNGERRESERCVHYVSACERVFVWEMESMGIRLENNWPERKHSSRWSSQPRDI